MSDFRFDLVAFGEALLRLSPPFFQRLEQAQWLEISVGGAELDAAVAATRLGMRTTFVTKVPDTSLGKIIVNKAREQGVDTSFVVLSANTGHGQDRMGLYFMEFGARPRASEVIYDRYGSAMANLKPGEIPWREILSQTRAFLVSGITPAISPAAAEVTAEALRVAKELGVLVSLDLNYRAKLWGEKEARETLVPLFPYVDILITTEEDANRVLGLVGEDYVAIARELASRFGFKVVTITLRETPSVWINHWTAIAYADGVVYGDVKYEGLELVDRVGAGDAYTGGFLAGYLKTGDVEVAVKTGNAIAALKHSIPGHFAWVSLQEVERLVHRGMGNLRIIR